MALSGLEGSLFLQLSCLKVCNGFLNTEVCMPLQVIPVNSIRAYFPL